MLTFFNEFKVPRYIVFLAPVLFYIVVLSVYYFGAGASCCIEMELGPVKPASLARILCCWGDEGIDDKGELWPEGLIPLSDTVGTFDRGLRYCDLVWFFNMEF